MTAFSLRTSSLIALTALAACAPNGGDPSKQYGSNPELPKPQQYVMPPFSVPLYVGWKAGETPTVPRGLQIQAMATGFEHPRVIYPLPNGDILVVEANAPPTVLFRPKDYLNGPIVNRAGAGQPGGNRMRGGAGAGARGFVAVPALHPVYEHHHEPEGDDRGGGRRQAAGKRDDLGALGDLQDLADERALQLLRAF